MKRKIFTKLLKINLINIMKRQTTFGLTDAALKKIYNTSRSHHNSYIEWLGNVKHHYESDPHDIPIFIKTKSLVKNVFHTH